jgi:hypothetical protein
MINLLMSLFIESVLIKFHDDNLCSIEFIKGLEIDWIEGHDLFCGIVIK